jgi:hypothetical protein
MTSAWPGSAVWAVRGKVVESWRDLASGPSRDQRPVMIVLGRGSP